MPFLWERPVGRDEFGECARAIAAHAPLPQRKGAGRPAILVGAADRPRTDLVNVPTNFASGAHNQTHNICLCSFCAPPSWRELSGCLLKF